MDMKLEIIFISSFEASQYAALLGWKNKNNKKYGNQNSREALFFSHPESKI